MSFFDRVKLFGKKKYPIIEVESTEQPPNYIELLIAEKDTRIEDLERYNAYLISDNEFLRAQLMTIKIPNKEFNINGELPKPVVRFMPFGQVKNILEHHYKERADKAKVKS